MLWRTCVAAVQFAFPGWFASMTQVPFFKNVTVPEAIEHTPLDDLSIVSDTTSPDVAVAMAVYLPPLRAGAGGLEEKEMVCVALATVTRCWTWEAPEYSAFPVWLASRTHVPDGPGKVTRPLAEL